MATEAKQKPPNTQKDTTGLWIAFFIGLLLLCISAAYAHSHSLSGLQARIFYDFNNLSGSYTAVAKVITEGLGAAYPIVICVLVPLVMKKYRLAWRFFFTTAGALVVGFIVKYLVDEPRPIAMLGGHLHQRVIETGPGFPSGHMLAATALALTLWFILPAKWRWLSALWILLVAWSRIYLGVHTMADVVGGFAIGLMAVCFVRLLLPSVAKPLRLDEG